MSTVKCVQAHGAYVAGIVGLDLEFVVDLDRLVDVHRDYLLHAVFDHLRREEIRLAFFLH